MSDFGESEVCYGFSNFIQGWKCLKLECPGVLHTVLIAEDLRPADYLRSWRTALSSTAVTLAHFFFLQHPGARQARSAGIKLGMSPTSLTQLVNTKTFQGGALFLPTLLSRAHLHLRTAVPNGDSPHSPAMAPNERRNSVCPHCQRSFVRLEHLQRHVRTRMHQCSHAPHYRNASKAHRFTMRYRHEGEALQVLLQQGLRAQRSFDPPPTPCAPTDRARASRPSARGCIEDCSGSGRVFTTFSRSLRLSPCRREPCGCCCSHLISARRWQYSGLRGHAALAV